MIPEKVVSGGQTGADRAGLDAAMEAGISVGGYCPKGRLAEDGKVPDLYPLTELTKGGYPARTEKNVVESDGTLILNIGKITGGTKLTVEFAKKHGKPFLVVQLDSAITADITLRWIHSNNVHTLNIAGPRESKCPGLHTRALKYLRQVFMSESGGTYSITEENIITPNDTPPLGWMGTWGHQDPYK